MKRICILLLALLPISAAAQELAIDHEKKDVVYTCSHESSLSYDDILEYILAYGVLDNVVTHRNMIAGDLPPVVIDYKAAGYSRGSLPLFFVNGQFTCRIIIHAYDGHYDIEACQMAFLDYSGQPSMLYDMKDANSFMDVSALTIRHLNKFTMFQ